MYFWTIWQDAMNRSLIFIENSSIYHMVRSLSFRIASPRICTVSVGLFFLKYFSVSFGKNHGNWILRTRNISVWFCLFHDLMSFCWSQFKFCEFRCVQRWSAILLKNPHLLTIALSILLKEETDFIEPQLLWNHTKSEIFFIWRIGIVYCSS